jgi:hypothetical protein
MGAREKSTAGALQKVSPLVHSPGPMALKSKVTAMNLSLFDKAGRYQAPNAETLAALSDPERAAIARIGEAAAVLDAANVAAKENADALKATQTEIAALEKIVPRVTRIDLVKQMSADTQRRRAGV